jgi:hypothetical protein
MAACLPTATAQDATQPAGAQDPPQRLVPQAAAGGEWSVYSSPEAGIELKMPPGQPVPSDDATVLAQVVDAERSWKFELRRLPLETPMNLEPEEMPEGGRRAGLLELMTSTAQQNTQGEILRQGLTPLGDADAGVYAIRFSLGLTTQLQQVALIRASNTLYYQLMLTSPAPAGPIEQIQQDPAVREAVEAFQTSLNSFKVLDQSKLREEQEQRLIRTRPARFPAIPWPVRSSTITAPPASASAVEPTSAATAAGWTGKPGSSLPPTCARRSSASATS